MDMCQFCLKPTKSNMTFMIEIFCYLLAVKHNFVFPAFWSQPSFGTKKEKQVSSKKTIPCYFCNGNISDTFTQETDPNYELKSAAFSVSARHVSCVNSPPENVHGYFLQATPS